MEGSQAVPAHEPETCRHMGMIDFRCAMLLAAGTTAFAADCPGFLFAVEALRISSHSSCWNLCVDYLAKDDDYQSWESVVTH